VTGLEREHQKSTGESQAPEPSLRNIRAIAELEAESKAARGPLERISERISGFASSPSFIALHVVWFGAWILVNRSVRHPIDPYPFTFLTFLTSLEAIFLTSFVLISQSHLEQLSHRRAALDLQVNLLAEAEMTKILFAVRRICDHLGIDAVRNDPETQAMEADTDVTALSAALDYEAERHERRSAR
jgi:uncharacterized membrane protein